MSADNRRHDAATLVEAFNNISFAVCSFRSTSNPAQYKKSRTLRYEIIRLAILRSGALLQFAYESLL